MEKMNALESDLESIKDENESLKVQVSKQYTITTYGGGIFAGGTTTTIVIIVIVLVLTRRRVQAMQ